MNAIAAPADGARAAEMPVPPDPVAPHVYQWPRWPLRDHLELAVLDMSAGMARKRARAVLWEWGLKALADDAGSVVTELVSNAVNSTHAERLHSPVHVWLYSRRTDLTILVWDVSARHPVISSDFSDESEHGRGLIVVAGLTGGRWGYYLPLPPCGGKVVWAILSAPKGLIPDTMPDAASADPSGNPSPERAVA